MALELNICQTSVNADCSEFTLTDNTGNYHATDNPGGYGTPNLQRNAVALFVHGFKYMKDEDDQDITDLINNTDPIYVTSWPVVNTLDGYYYFNIFAIKTWRDDVIYNIGDLVYYNQSYYKTLISNIDSQPSDINTNYEVLTSLIGEEDNPSLGAYQEYRMVQTCRVETCYATVVKDASIACGCPDCLKDQNFQMYQRLDVLLQALFINIGQENFIEADSIVSTMIGYCKKTSCKVC